MAQHRAPSAALVAALIQDGFVALGLALHNSRDKLLRSWLYVPASVVIILLACFGVDVLLKLGSVAFPASVACLVLLFLGLLVSEWVLGNSRTRHIVRIIDVPAGWSLRWINVFFIPTFVTLPLSSPIGVGEVMKIIAVFIVGFAVMMIVTAYMTRGLQLVTGSSKRAHAQRADELGPTEDEIPIARAAARNNTEPPTPSLHSTVASATELGVISSPPRVHGAGMPTQEELPQARDPVLRAVPAGNEIQAVQTPLLPTRSRLWAAYLARNLDWITFAVLLITAGLPICYATGYMMPLHLCITVLAYFTAMALPPLWRQYLHPVLVSALLCVLTIWVFAATRHRGLLDDLVQYRTGLRYLQLWEGARTSTALPGAGDVFGTVLDASIVSLALPMYQYRRELREHFAAIIVPNVLVSIASVFSYPYICHAIGISSARSLSFAARSLTLALATPAVENLGGDVSTVAAVAIMSGVVGVLVGQRMLAVMKIPEDDYVTRGVTLGANSSALATALLLRTDPRAAALSSLSMSLFGTITVLFTSVPPIRDLIRSLVA